MTNTDFTKGYFLGLDNTYFENYSETGSKNFCLKFFIRNGNYKNYIT